MIRINNNPLQTIMQKRVTNEWDRLGTFVFIQSLTYIKKDSMIIRIRMYAELLNNGEVL